jgi:serine/threonine protein phosphatase PrpC
MSLQTSGFDIAALTDTGRKRKDNQDTFMRADFWLGADRKEVRNNYGRLYIVADGVGGNDEGDVASRMVVDSVMEYFYTDEAAPRDRIERLRYAIERTSAAIHVEARHRKNNMASTIVAALIYDGKLTIANVGDSSALLLRPDQPPKKLTIDHVRKGSDGSQTLAQAMGDAEVSVALFTTDFAPDDVTVLCSDGLTDLVQPAEIARMVRRSSARDATRALIRLANARGGHDNITALVVRNGKLPFLAQRKYRQTLGAGAVVLLLAALLILLVPSMFGPLSTAAPNVNSSGPSFDSDGVDAGSTPKPTIALMEAPTATSTQTATPRPVLRATPRPAAPAPQQPTPAQQLAATDAPAPPTDAPAPPTDAPAPPPPTETPETSDPKPSKSCPPKQRNC